MRIRFAVLTSFLMLASSLSAVAQREWGRPHPPEVGACFYSDPGFSGQYFCLKDGERWRYTPPAGHTVAWLAISAGRLDVNGMVGPGELAVFEESEQVIDCVAHGGTSFVLGSAVKHPHDLVMGYYSVHTSKAALAKGEAEIQRIVAELRRDKRIG